MGAGKSTANPDMSSYRALPSSKDGVTQQKYTSNNGKVTTLYGFNKSTVYSAPEAKPVEVNESEWIKNNSKSNSTRNVYKHKSNNSKIRTNYKHNNGTKNTLYSFNKNKTYVDPELKKLMEINKDSIKLMINNLKEKFEDNDEIYPVIVELEKEIKPVMNSDNPTQKNIDDASKRIKNVIHHETVVKPLQSQIPEPSIMLIKGLGSTIMVALKIATAVPLMAATLVMKGGTRRKRQARHHRTQRR